MVTEEEGFFSAANKLFARWRLGIFIPLLFLLVDFWQYPSLKHSQMVANGIASRDVASQAAVYVGRLKGHRILVSSDDIYDLQSFEDLQGKNVGLIIPHILTKMGIATQSGSLGRGVLNSSSFIIDVPHRSGEYKKLSHSSRTDPLVRLWTGAFSVMKSQCWP